MVVVFDFLRTVVFLSKLWEAILCVDKLPENAATDKLNTNMCQWDFMGRDFLPKSKSLWRALLNLLCRELVNLNGELCNHFKRSL